MGDGEREGGNGTPTAGELKRWLERVDRDTARQWSEIRAINTTNSRIETKLDTLLERRAALVQDGEETTSTRIERMHAVWTFIGKALATGIPAAMVGATAVIAYLEYAS